MSLIFYMTLIGLSSSFAGYGYWRLSQVKGHYQETKRHVFPLEKEQELIDKRQASYEALQSEYQHNHRALVALEDRIDQHHIGIGSYDSVLYRRNVQITDLENLENELLHISHSIRSLRQNGRVTMQRGENTNRQIHTLFQQCFDAEAEAAQAHVTW